MLLSVLFFLVQLLATVGTRTMAATVTAVPTALMAVVTVSGSVHLYIHAYFRLKILLSGRVLLTRISRPVSELECGQAVWEAIG